MDRLDLYHLSLIWLALLSGAFFYVLLV